MAVNPEIERRAHALLEEAGLLTCPVDPVAVANHLGLRVRIAEFEDESISGMLRDGMIYVNYTDMPQRQRFTIAHEIAHSVLHETKSDLHRQDGVRTQVEREADAFAGALLIPEVLLRRLIGQGVCAIDELAKAFQVSKQSMRVRINHLRMGGLLRGGGIP